jgi:hypothetical protein
MEGRAMPTADIMNGMRKCAVQTTKRVAEREMPEFSETAAEVIGARAFLW